MLLKFILLTTLISYLISSFGFWFYLLTKNRLGSRIGYSFFGIGFLLELIYVGISDYKVKSFALASSENLPLLISIIIGGIFYGLSLKYKEQLKDFGSVFAPINVFLTALVLPNVEKLPNANKDLWFLLHVIFSTISFGFILAAAIIAIIYILTDRDLKNKKLDSFFVSKFSSSLVLLEKIGFKLNVLAFIFLSLALIASSVWSSTYLGKHWLWDYKQVALLVLWLYYGFLVHYRLIKGKRGKEVAYLTVLGGFLATVVFWILKHPSY